MELWISAQYFLVFFFFFFFFFFWERKRKREREGFARRAWTLIARTVKGEGQGKKNCPCPPHPTYKSNAADSTKGLFKWKWENPGRWGNPPSHGRKVKRVYMQSYTPGCWGEVSWGCCCAWSHGRFTTLNIPKCGYFTLLVCPLWFLVIFAMRRLGNVQSF